MSPTSPVGAGFFGSLYSHGFVRVAAAVPHVELAEPLLNAERTVGLAQRASADHAALVVFPELGLTGYSLEDLFHQQSLQDAVLDALEQLLAASAELLPVIVVGAPLLAAGGVFNNPVVLHRGRGVGDVPKSDQPE